MGWGLGVLGCGGACGGMSLVEACATTSVEDAVCRKVQTSAKVLVLANASTCGCAQARVKASERVPERARLCACVPVRERLLGRVAGEGAHHHHGG